MAASGSPTPGTGHPVAKGSRRRIQWIVGCVTLLVVLLAAGFWVTDTWRLPGDDGPRLAARASPLPVAPNTGPTCRSPLTAAAPLRVWIGGDSLAGTLGPSLGTLAGSTGVAQAEFDSRASSGLADPGFFNWPLHATESMATLNPETVVFIMGTNDWMTPQAQPTDATGAPAWKARYAAQVGQMLNILSGSNRFVYWVGGPTIRDPATDAGVRQIDDVARVVVSQHHDAVYVDAYQLFGDSQGHYSATLPPGLNGKPILVRTDDGIHFTPDGGDRLARAIFTPLDERCRLLAQAVPGSPKPVIEVPGSTQLPNTSRGSNPPSGTTPTTQPPIIVAPTTPPSTQATTTTTPPTAPPTAPPTVTPPS